MKDKFLNFTNVDTIVSNESLMSQDLGMSYDFDGKTKEYQVKENFDKFFVFKTGDMGSIDCYDTIDNIEHSIVGFSLNNQYLVCGFGFNIMTKNFKFTNEERWDMINIGCLIHLGLELSNYGSLDDYNIDMD